MCGGGGLGGILGSLGGGLLDVAFPEVGIPLSIATGLGGFGGTLLGDVATGKSLGQSILPALETGGISGALAGVGNIAAGGDFFGAPASSLSGIFGGAAPTDATTAATTAAATPLTTTAATAPSTALTSAAPTAIGTGGLGGGAVTDIGSTLTTATGGAPANLGGAAVGAGGVPTGPAGALGPAGAAGPTSLTGGGTSGAFIPGVDTAGVTDVGGQVPGVTGGGSGGSFLSRLFGGGGGITAPTTTTDAAGNITSIAGGGGSTGGGSMLSRGLFGEPGSLTADLTKPTTLLTAGAAALPLLQGNTIPGLSNLENQARSLNLQGTQLAQSLNTGNLPPGAQASLDAATRSAAAQVRSRYAALGLSGSSQEADALATVDQTAAANKYADLLKTTQTGIQEMGMASPILTQIMQTQLAQDQAQQQAIARLAAALAGSTGTEKTTA